jgi:hypothetical protein
MKEKILVTTGYTTIITAIELAINLLDTANIFTKIADAIAIKRIDRIPLNTGTAKSFVVFI